ncbi:MAG: tripartite tricarboxylate transporter substrate binding protein [Betaproteobacteria bacterium]
MRALLVLLTLLAASPQALSQYPAKPIRLVVGFAPGGAADAVSRAIGDPLGRLLGQPLVIDNRPGNGSSLAAELVAKAPADGYTMLIASPSSQSVNPAMNPHLAYVPERDFAPITKVTSSPLVVAVHPSVPAKSIRELIAYAKKAPGKLNYGSSGNGSAPHLGAVLFSRVAGVEMVHVPYKGGGPAVQALLAGDVQLAFATPPSVLPLVQGGRLRGLAVTTRTASPSVPGLPGMEEAGLPGYDLTFWYGFFVPAATPPEVVKKLFTATSQVLQRQDVKQLLAREGTDVVGSKSPEEFAQFLREDAKLWQQLVKDTGAKVD